MDWKKVGKNTLKYSSPVGFAVATTREHQGDPEYQATKEEEKRNKSEAKQAKRQARLASLPDHSIRVGGLTDPMITIKDGRIHGPTRHHGNVALSGATAVVETSGDVDRRVTAARLIMTGPFALGLRKKKDTRELFLTVEGSDGVFVVEVKPDQQKRAREAAARITTLGKQAAAGSQKVVEAQASEPETPVSQGKVTVELTHEQAAKLKELLGD